jgi:hypothetical protein
MLSIMVQTGTKLGSFWQKRTAPRLRSAPLCPDRNWVRSGKKAGCDALSRIRASLLCSLCSRCSIFELAPLVLRGSPAPLDGLAQTPRPTPTDPHPHLRLPAPARWRRPSPTSWDRTATDPTNHAGTRCGSTSSCPEPSSALCCAGHWCGWPRSAFRSPSSSS